MRFLPCPRIERLLDFLNFVLLETGSFILPRLKVLMLRLGCVHDALAVQLLADNQ